MHCALYTSLFNAHKDTVPNSALLLNPYGFFLSHRGLGSYEFHHIEYIDVHHKKTGIMHQNI